MHLGKLCEKKPREKVRDSIQDLRGATEVAGALGRRGKKRSAV